MFRLTIAIVAVFLCSCASTEVTLTLGARRVNGETDPGGFLMIAQRFGKHGICAITHTSDPSSGRPFNDDFEINSDTVGCGVRFGGR